MRSTRHLAVALLWAYANAAIRIPTPLAFRPLSKANYPPATTLESARTPTAPASFPLASRSLFGHQSVTVLSYLSLGLVSAGSIMLVKPVLAWKGALLVAGSVAMPAGMLVAQMVGPLGSGGFIAKQMGGRPADAWLTDLANEAADKVGVARPKQVFIVPAKEPNAFAAGLRERDTSVAVTEGLTRMLDRNELGAVMAHEMGHLRHKDVARNMHIAIAAAGLGGLYRAGRYILEASREERSSSKDDDDEKGSSTSVGLTLAAAGLAGQATAHLLRLGASRSAELAADAAAAQAYGPSSLASALKKIHAAPENDLHAGSGAAMAHAMFSAGGKGAPSRGRGPTFVLRKSNFLLDNKVGEKVRGFFRWSNGLMSTHPSLETRLKALGYEDDSDPPSVYYY